MDYHGKASHSDDRTMRTAAFALAVLLIAPLTALTAPDRAALPPALSAGIGEPAAAPAPSWRRPDVPVRVALQAGHWKAAEAPDEQAQLRTNGTSGGGRAEWEVNLAIAVRAADLLERLGYDVDILPTTIPPGYWADAFISIHADGNPNASVNGYRAAAPRRDRTGRAHELAEVLNEEYGAATGLEHYPLITRRMRSYYAFNSRRYRHALHPMTVGVILETGFLTSPRDRRIIVDAQDRAARGITDAVVRFLGTNVVEKPLGSPAGGARAASPAR